MGGASGSGGQKREREEAIGHNELDRHKRSRKPPIRLETESINNPNESETAPSTKVWFWLASISPCR